MHLLISNNTKPVSLPHAKISLQYRTQRKASYAETERGMWDDINPYYQD